jgi:hypothetical protein
MLMVKAAILCECVRWGCATKWRSAVASTQEGRGLLFFFGHSGSRFSIQRWGCVWPISRPSRAKWIALTPPAPSKPTHTPTHPSRPSRRHSPSALGQGYLLSAPCRVSLRRRRLRKEGSGLPYQARYDKKPKKHLEMKKYEEEEEAGGEGGEEVRAADEPGCSLVVKTFLDTVVAGLIHPSSTTLSPARALSQ